MNPSIFTTVLCLLFGIISADNRPKVTDRVTFDITIGGKAAGSIVIGVFGDIVPITAKNFIELASGINGYGYEGSKFHRVIPEFMIQGGDYDKKDGSGFKSIYGGGYFDDENFILDHYERGWVSMANAGKDTNGCQFFITMKDTPWLDGHHVVFGKIIQGMDLAVKISQVDTTQTDAPVHEIIISKSTSQPQTEDLYIDLK